MATIGLDKLFYAKITEGENGEETYAEPKQLAKAMTADLSVELAEATLYADDGVAEVVKEFKRKFYRTLNILRNLINKESKSSVFLLSVHLIIEIVLVVACATLCLHLSRKSDLVGHCSIGLRLIEFLLTCGSQEHSCDCRSDQ